MFYKMFCFVVSNFMLTIVICQGNSFAQLSGIYSIPGVPFTTIESAIDSLNQVGVGAGGVTFNVAAGHTETFSSSASGKLSASGTTANPIIFQKSGGGANPEITAGTGSGTLDGIIVIRGGDYITFDGIDVSENPANIDNITRMEWGYAMLKRSTSAPADGCSFVTIGNSTITLDKQNTATWGIYTANHSDTSSTSSAMTDSLLDVMSFCKFYSNTITNSYSGIRSSGSTNTSFYDQSNEIGVDGVNNIINFGGGTLAAYGIEVQYHYNIKIANNVINNVSGAGHSGILYGIRTGSGLNADVDIYGNTLTLTQGGSSLIYAIVNSMGSSGNGNTVNIYNNIVENCLQPVSTSNTVWLIYNLAGCSFLNIYDNIVRNNTKSAGTGTMYCIYNTPPSTPTKVEIYNNDVYNNTSAGPIHGILADDGMVLNIYRNNIYNITSTSASTSALAIAGITIPSGPIETNIYNNFISDLKSPSSGFATGLRGINITSTTANSTIGLYYNTIYVNTSGVSNFGSAGIYHTNSTTATTAALDMRNNIVVNLSAASGTGKTAVFRRSASNVNLNNYSNLSNNNAFYAGTPSASNVIFFDGTNFDQTMPDFKTRVAPRESNSVTENVPFINPITPPYDMHIRTDIATQTESGGTSVTSPVSITTDFDDDTRNATTPDIGADEFNGIGIDLTPPSIIYTALDHTISTSNRILGSVSITDLNGVNVTSGTRPRVYYKKASHNNTYVDNTSSTNGWKYTETSNSSSPFEFTINYSLLLGGAGVQNGDTVQYFVAAQDLFSTPNVGINNGVFASTPSSVNLTPAAFPITGTINFYRIIISLNGIVTVGTGGNYSSLTGSNGLFKSINENIVSGNLTAEIISNTSESGSSALNQWVEDVSDGNYTLTIQPSSAVLKTISGSAAGGLIVLNGADRVIIDGRFGGSGNYLTIENTNAVTNTAAIRLISLGAGQGASDITIRNCNIKAGTNSVANTFGIFSGSSTGSVSTGNAGGADYDNISIIENNFSKCRVGVFARGTTTDQMTNFIVSGNVIGSDNASEYVTEYGSYLGYVDAPQVTYNEVYNLIFDVSKWGIYFIANVNNAVVSKNKVHSIKQPGTTGFNSVGIYFSSATGCSDNQIDNNMIYDLSTYGNTSMFLVGIRITGGTNYKVYYNSVSINDSVLNPAASLVSSCLYISPATTNIDVRNNIFLNTRTGNSPKNYAVHSPNTTTFAFINYNNYLTTGNVFGFWGADVPDFDTWKSTVGQDLNSLNINPLFTSSTDLHINSGLTPTPLESGGTEIISITTDIDEDVRPGPAGSVNGGATEPDIGADEFDGVPYAIPDTVFVSVMNNFFNPADFIIQVGDYIKWTLMEGVHTTTSNTIPPGAAPWNYHFTGVGDFFVYQVTVAGNYNYECLHHPGMNGMFTAVESSTFQLSVDVINSWNMVSAPGLHPVNQSVDFWWIFRDPNTSVFKFAGSYTPVTVTDPGEGYWMKHVGARTYNTGDEWPAGGIIIVPHDPVSAATGWNLVGGYDVSVPVVSVTTTPPGLITTTIYGYNGSYVPATHIVPGYAYWVKMDAAGSINLGGPLGKEGAKTIAQIKEEWGKITITDAAERTFTLYAVNGKVNLNQFELPPAPPAGSFDVRFTSNRMVEDISSSVQTIDMTAVEYPVTVSVENMSIKLLDETGRLINQNIKSGEKFTISNSSINKLKVSGELIPDEYALEQNYPNPFNPSTTIEFSLPEDVNSVKLTIYNALGERVAELVNGSLMAGKYQYQWDAKNVATGMYIYELRTDNFVSIKKMVLLK